MELILIPGFWLDGASWDEVAEPLREAGHTVHALTLPGLESRDAERSAITLRDHIDAVIAAVDAVHGPVALVGHSGGGGIAHGVVDARPLAIDRVIYVDSSPLDDGDCINDGLPVVNGEVPLPEWSFFEDDDLIDLTDDLRARFRSIAIPEPARVTSDKQVLSDVRRYDVPVTVICCEFTAEQVLGWIEKGYANELSKIKAVQYIDLPTGHWPQLTRPADLAGAILTAVGG